MDPITIKIGSMSPPTHRGWVLCTLDVPSGSKPSLTEDQWSHYEDGALQWRLRFGAGSQKLAAYWKAPLGTTQPRKPSDCFLRSHSQQRTVHPLEALRTTHSSWRFRLQLPLVFFCGGGRYPWTAHSLLRRLCAPAEVAASRCPRRSSGESETVLTLHKSTERSSSHRPTQDATLRNRETLDLQTIMKQNSISKSTRNDRSTKQVRKTQHWVCYNCVRNGKHHECHRADLGAFAPSHDLSTVTKSGTLGQYCLSATKKKLTSNILKRHEAISCTIMAPPFVDKVQLKVFRQQTRFRGF